MPVKLKTLIRTERHKTLQKYKKAHKAILKNALLVQLFLNFNIFVIRIAPLNTYNPSQTQTNSGCLRCRIGI
jgi:hypothetical protein